jgi:methionyl-tRNA synthetase
MPETAQKMLDKFGLSLENVPSLQGFDIATEINALPVGSSFEVGDPLFERISPEKIAELQEKYKGGK